LAGFVASVMTLCLPLSFRVRLFANHHAAKNRLFISFVVLTRV
jgi:hypothetical protein